MPNSVTGVSLDRQEEVIRMIRDNPFDSFLFEGLAGVGKSTMAREIIRTAHTKAQVNFAVYSRSAVQWQQEATQWALTGQPQLAQSIVPAVGWLQRVRWLVHIDDLDKLRGTEFIQTTFHDLIDTIVVHNAQFVATTNMTRAELKGFLGDAVYRRIDQHCRWVKLARV
jgi:DNA replication protein DnaC